MKNMNIDVFHSPLSGPDLGPLDVGYKPDNLQHFSAGIEVPGTKPVTGIEVPSTYTVGGIQVPSMQRTGEGVRYGTGLPVGGLIGGLGAVTTIAGVLPLALVIGFFIWRIQLNKGLKKGKEPSLPAKVLHWDLWNIWYNKK